MLEPGNRGLFYAYFLGEFDLRATVKLPETLKRQQPAFAFTGLEELDEPSDRYFRRSINLNRTFSVACLAAKDAKTFARLIFHSHMLFSHPNINPRVARFSIRCIHLNIALGQAIFEQHF